MNEFGNGWKVTCCRHAGVHAQKGECRDVEFVAPIGRERIESAPAEES